MTLASSVDLHISRGDLDHPINRAVYNDVSINPRLAQGFALYPYHSFPFSFMTRLCFYVASLELCNVVHLRHAYCFISLRLPLTSCDRMQTAITCELRPTASCQSNCDHMALWSGRVLELRFSVFLASGLLGGSFCGLRPCS